MTHRIPLTQGQFATVCDCHYHLVKDIKWQAAWSKSNQEFRAQSSTPYVDGKRTTIMMHAVVNNTPVGFETDHINRDTLDNRCTNLRSATHQQNQHNHGLRVDNTSGYMGVSPHNKGWQATISINKQQIYLGKYKTAEIAARVYDEAARKHFGEFANLNFPDG